MWIGAATPASRILASVRLFGLTTFGLDFLPHGAIVSNFSATV
jgi:hypothetical protein